MQAKVRGSPEIVQGYFLRIIEMYDASQRDAQAVLAQKNLAYSNYIQKIYSKFQFFFKLFFYNLFYRKAEKAND